MRLPLLLTALALLCAACDSAERCATDDDCFSQERCVKAAGASEGSCDKIVTRADMGDMGAELGMPGDEMGPGPADMDAPDLPPAADTLAQCLSAGCLINGGGSCVAAGGEVRCAMPVELASCLERRVLGELDARLPVRAHALGSGVERAGVIMGTARSEPQKLVSFELIGPDKTPTPLYHELPGAATVEALTSYDEAANTRVVAAASYQGAGGRRLALPSFITGVAPNARQLLIEDTWSVDRTYCGGPLLEVQLTELCDGSPVKLSAAPQTATGEVQDLVLAACMKGMGNMTNVLIQLRPGDLTMHGPELELSAPLDACSAPTLALSITELDAGLGGEPRVSASSGHLWTLQQEAEPVVRRYDWRGSDAAAGVSAMQFAFQQTKGMNDELLLTKVREECDVDANAVWESRTQMVALGSTLDRDVFFYFGSIGGRAVAVRYRLGDDTSTISCPRAWRGMRWVDAVQTEDGWLAVGKQGTETGVMIIRSRTAQLGDADLQHTNILSSGVPLEPLALIRHRDGAASLVVQRGANTQASVAHVYLTDDGAPECP